jgi:hypothetical protein
MWEKIKFSIRFTKPLRNQGTTDQQEFRAMTRMNLLCYDVYKAVFIKTVVRGGPRVASKEKTMQTLYQTLNE